MPNIQIDVDGVDKTLNDIRRDLHRGMEKAADRIADNAKADARSRIKEEDAIFNTEVYAGFKTAETFNSPSRVRKKLYNDVDHAEPLESGAEYTSKGPPVVALLPWVVRKMNWKAASRDTDFDSNKNYIPDSWNGGDDRDDDDDENDQDGSDEKSESISERFDGPLTDRNELNLGEEDESKPIYDRYDDADRFYTDDFDRNITSNYEKSERFLVEQIDKDKVSVKEVSDVTEDYVEFDGTLISYRYYFSHVDDRDKAEYDVNTSESIYELDILGKKDVKRFNDLEADDKILIDGDKSSIDDWDDKTVFATVDSGTDYHRDTVEVHAKYSNKTVSINSEEYLFSKGDNPDTWNWDGASTGSKVEYFDGIHNEIKTGYISTEPEIYNNNKAYQTATGRAINPEDGNHKYIDSDEVVSIDESINFWEDAPEPVPDNDILNNEEVEDFTDEFSAFEEGQRYRIWNHHTQEFMDAEVASKSTHTNSITISPIGDSLSRTQYYLDDSDRRKNKVWVTPIAKYKQGEGWDHGYAEENGQNLLWYGQEVTYKIDGETKTGIVSDWDKRNVYLSDADVDKVPRIPTIEQDETLTGGEKWNEVIPDDKKSEQLYSEILYRVSHGTNSEEFVETFAEFIRDDYFSWVKKDKLAQETITQMNALTETKRLGIGGAMSPTGGYEEYQFDLKLKLINGEFDKLTAHHEMMHAILHSNKIKNDGNELAKGFTGGIKDISGPWNEWPETVFDFDGTADSSRFSEIEIDDHGDIGQYLVRNQLTDTVYGDETFGDIIVDVPLDEKGLDTVSDEDLVRDISGPDLFDESDFNIRINDVLEIENDNGDKVKGVYSSVSTSEDPDHKFTIGDDESFKVVTDSDGNVTRIDAQLGSNTPWEISGYYESQKEPLDEPVTDWMPKNDNPLVDFSEAANRSLKKQLWVMQKDDTEGKLFSNRISILRGYAASNAHETAAGLTTIMQSKSFKHAALMPKIYNHHPFLVKSYLEIYEPSDIVREKLEDIDDPELNKYL